MKKLIAIILALMICASLVGCATDGAPDGMTSATLEGEPFVLYVPEGFIINTSSGISSAYYSSVDNNSLTVSARYTAAGDKTLDEYMEYCANAYAESLEGFEKTAEVSGAMLAGSDARKLAYKMTVDGVDYKAVQITVKYNGDMISLNYYTTGDGMNVFADLIAEIVENFKLCEKTAQTGDCVTDKKTPEGMKIASSDVVEYRFYVPMSWVCNSESGISEAYYPESEKTNVTVTSFSPSNDITLDEYYADCLEDYEKNIEGFGLVGETTDVTVAEKAAKRFTFIAKYDGVDYKICQVVLWSGQNGLFYTFTYTAVEQNFDLHIADFDAMLGAFIFR